MFRFSPLIPVAMIALLGGFVLYPAILATMPQAPMIASVVVAATIAAFISIPLNLLLLRRAFPMLGRILAAGIAVAAILAFATAPGNTDTLGAILARLGLIKPVILGCLLGFVAFAVILPFVEVDAARHHPRIRRQRQS